jgi:hypothetical protein
MAKESLSEFEKAAQRGSRDNIFTDCWYFIRFNKKWWLLPIIITVVLLGGLMILSSTAAAPFIYTVF